MTGNIRDNDTDLAAERDRILDAIRLRFNVSVLVIADEHANRIRPDASRLLIYPKPPRLDVVPSRRMTEEEWTRIRQFVRSEDWHIARNHCRNQIPNVALVKQYVIAPCVPVPIEVAYHATRIESLPSIFELGLLPSTPDRQTSADRLDCEGNIYFCERPGGPEDAGRAGARSAHWWCDHLSKNNRFGDPDWCILKVDVSIVDGLCLYRDLFSESGIIADGVDAIPPNAICRIA